MGEVFVALGGADSLQRAAVAPDWRVGGLQAESRRVCKGKNGKILLTNRSNGSIIKKPQGNLRTWGHRARDFSGLL